MTGKAATTATTAAASRAGGKGHSRNKSYLEMAAERARKSQAGAQTQQQRRASQQPTKRTTQSQSPQGVVTKFRDIADIPDRHGPIRFNDSDHDHDDDSLEDEAENLDRKSTRLNSSHQCAARMPSSA